MTIFTSLGRFCIGLWRFFAGPPAGAEFTCGECQKRESCGLPPSDACVAKAAQLADGYRRPIKL